MRYREVARLDLSNVEMECRACGVAMRAHSGGGGAIQYFRCPKCRRWVSSTYSDVLRSDSKFHARATGSAPRTAQDFEAVKGRLERWLASIDDQDPYRVLGVSPVDDDARIKARFRALAMEVHPDRGGSPDRMREVNLAYERILQHRARRATETARQPALAAVSSERLLLLQQRAKADLHGAPVLPLLRRTLATVVFATCTVAGAQAAEPSANADPALLRAILAAYEPAPAEIRAAAVEDLGLLGDPRALNVLADFALAPAPLVQQAAVRALRSFQHPRAEEILANLVRHPRPTEAIKSAALEALAYQRTASSEALLRSIRDDGRNGPHLQETAARLLARLGSRR